MSQAVGFLFAIVLLAILIIICNCFVIIPIAFMDTSSRTRSDIIKASLAVADLLPGKYFNKKFYTKIKFYTCILLYRTAFSSKMMALAGVKLALRVY